MLVTSINNLQLASHFKNILRLIFYHFKKSTKTIAMQIIYIGGNDKSWVSCSYHIVQRIAPHDPAGHRMVHPKQHWSQDGAPPAALVGVLRGVDLTLQSVHIKSKLLPSTFAETLRHGHHTNYMLLKEKNIVQTCRILTNRDSFSSINLYRTQSMTYQSI